MERRKFLKNLFYGGCGVITAGVISNCGRNKDLTNIIGPDNESPDGNFHNLIDQYTTDNPNDTTKNVSIQVNANDNSAIKKVTIYYKKTTDGAYNSVQANNIGNNIWEITAPLANEPAQYDIYATVSDHANNDKNIPNAQFWVKGTEAWGHAVFKSKWTALGGLNNNYIENTMVAPWADFYILEKGGASLLKDAVFNYRMDVGDEGSPADDATFSTAGKDPVVSVDNTKSKAELEAQVEFCWNNLQTI